MLKRKIKYEDFNGDEVEDVHYFNISKPELIEMEVAYKKGFGTFLQDIVDTKDNKELIKQFKEIVLIAYGVKTEDGKRFEKSDQLREEFSQTAAFQSLFMELATVDDAAVEFFKGIIPKDMRGGFEQSAKASALSSAPTPPST